MTETAAERRVATVRAFNRFFTAQVGALQSAYLHTPYSLTEARLIYEISHTPAGTDAEVTDLRTALDLDAGYLSRILKRLEADGITERERSATDGRRQIVRLTDAGEKIANTLEERSDERIRDLLERLTDADQGRLVGAMETIGALLAERPSRPGYVLRPPRPGDYGWVVQAHGALYGREFGWDSSFEGLVARIVANYLDEHDPARDSCWIAEVDGRPVGTVFCVHSDDPSVARLRLLLVDPRARGMGLGARLVDECVRFARESGYGELTLWTNSVLADARRTYERSGFVLRTEAAHHSFGKDLVGQHWSLDLSKAPS